MSELLTAYKDETLGCTRCPLAATRTQVVFGSGDPNADLMFVGEAPGFHEDQQGVPFVGQAGKLLDKLLDGIGLDARGRLHRERAQVPPSGQPRPAAGGDRGLRAAPLPADRADPADARRHARQLRHEAPLRQADSGSRACTASGQQVTLGGNDVTLYPLYHPAAALYTPLDAGGARAGLPAASRSCSDAQSRLKARSHWTREPEPEPVAERAARAGRPARPLLALPWSCARPRPGETEAIAGRLAAGLVPGDVVTVSGELGAGKTTFVRGACRALGVTAPVTSPTFTIGHRYRGRVDVSHLDLYRFTGVSAAEWGDLEPYFDDAVVLRRVARGRCGRPAASRRGPARARPTSRVPDRGDAGAPRPDRDVDLRRMRRAIVTST